ncbi:MAG: ATP-binding cassette domain-containing protein [Deltaproteobacteria bacterium]|nr:ATP-binding cassette domain-containing protein [Deltaproteobacteria bacterium]
MIHVEGITKYYGNFCAVDHINLDIQAGEIVGLLGPNGAGKTTTLRMLTGFFPPSAGNIQVKNYSIQQDPLAIKQLIGYLPESAPLYKSMIVYEYLDYVARIRGLSGEAKTGRLNALADMCGLRDIMHKTIDTLSKGLKQRVGLAHAMMSDPEILILDEPTSGLDPNQIVEIREIIRKIGEQKTVILSTHILREVEATCGRVVIINKGKIVADSDTHTLTAGHNRERRIQIDVLGADVQSLREQLESLSGVKAIQVAAAEEPHVIRACIVSGAEADIRPAVYAAVKQTNWILLEMRQEAETLEAIFRELTKEN